MNSRFSNNVEDARSFKRVRRPSVDDAEVIPFDEVRERSRKIRLRRAIQEGTYKPDLFALAESMLTSEDFLGE